MWTSPKVTIIDIVQFMKILHGNNCIACDRLSCC